MLWAYFDESGEHDQSGALTRLTVGGAVAPLEEWEALSLRWSALLEKFGLPFFHMTDFEARKPPFHELTNPDRLALLSGLLDIAVEHASEFVGFIGQPESGKAALVDAYETGLAKATREMAIDMHLSGQQLTVVFARHTEFSAERIGRWFDLWADADNSLVFGGVGNPNDLCPLQVADIVAYEISRDARSVRPEKTRYPFARLAPKMRPYTIKLIGRARAGFPNAWVPR
jgi:hypothetical protein